MEDVTSVEETQSIPLIVWLTGGPGCSLALASLTENDLCKVWLGGESTEINPHSWTQTAHMLLLDQPAGVGYSYGAKNDNNEEMVGEDAYYFLQSFIQTHPEYASNPLFIVGESYGGHYAPAIAHHIFLGNQELDNNDSSSTVKQLNLAGVAVGNGMTEPNIQFKYHAEMANYNSHGIKTVSDEGYQRMKDAIPQCITMVEGCNDALKTGLQEHFSCQAAYRYCMSTITSEYYETALNPYNICLECGNNPLCYNFSTLITKAKMVALHLKHPAQVLVE
uniref:Carboxypeptidase n=1 Tax=Proboscia inermis TaxID=420281 RepID=A0A7S0C631_9STRA|mmetsp:Transcript_27028/g.27402  ORF Transcript_27028/g.27402 Transcript_27028/m.27402 type:complete len:278 (+) Transcript_27028:333-1166(+)